jgi:hypothetical protein
MSPPLRSREDRWSLPTTVVTQPVVSDRGLELGVVGGGSAEQRVGAGETGTDLVSDLASRGYVVVTIDDTYDAAEVEFRGRRVVTPRPNQSPVDSVRIADTRFVLDELASLASATNPDAEHRALPNGLSTALDLAKVGMFGHSLARTSPLVDEMQLDGADRVSLNLHAAAARLSAGDLGGITR